MKIFIYTNCQGGAFEKLLPRLVDRDLSITFVENYKVINGDVALEVAQEAAKSADIFIYQPLGVEHGPRSTERGAEDTIGSLVSKRSLRVSMPYIYNDALWPLFEDGPKIRNEDVIIDLVKLGAEPADILEMYDQGKIDWRFDARFINTDRILREKEADLDIKVADVISQNLKLSPVMLTQNHPCSVVFSSVLTQFLSIAGWMKVSASDRLEEWTRVDTNIAELPGRWPTDRYAVQHYRFDYDAKIDEWAHEFYRSLVQKVLLLTP
ncbi:WcbI family polysaccharide biosynthesis putative acetyltransferase [Asticcacaulis sp. W401b]|uniref:WcbI family polysaccharide biosynthesis putative acetyltransferase n=1 Tax=Asticcacaulis sp. W401b TaxID=3388666 RepID=UPI003970E859